MSRTGEGFEEVLCVRAPKGTERRIGVLRRKAGVPRAVLLRQLVEHAIERYERTPETLLKRDFARNL